jgi:SecD/SecF fusion protein
MQNKGFIKFFAIALALACIFQLSFTFVVRKVQSDAKDFAQGNLNKETRYLDSIANEPVYNFLWLKKYTFRDCQEKGINLGLDLKGGMNVTLEVSVSDVIRSLAHFTNDSTFNKAIAKAKEMQKNSSEDIITLFGKAFQQMDPNAKLAAFFISKDLKIDFNTPNDEVLKIVRKESDGAISNSFNVLRNRIDRFGVTQPNIQKIATTGRILIELPGVKDPERVRKLLQGTANLEFWQTFENGEVYPLLEKANSILAEIIKNKGEQKDSALKVSNDTTKAVKDTTNSLLETIKSQQDTSAKSKGKKGNTPEQFKQDNPLFSVLYPNVDNEKHLAKGAAVGLVLGKDTADVNKYLSYKQVKALFPANMKFLWSYKPLKNTEIYQLIAIKIDPRTSQAPLDGSAITNARVDFNNMTNEPEVSMSMNGEGSNEWARLTRENIGRQIAIVLDNYVYSFPVVRQEIKGGSSSISGGFTLDEATDLANILQSGKLPAPAVIIEEAVVGPTLGKENINASFISFILAFILVLSYMIFFYGKPGIIANAALVANIFFQIGILASLGAVLTLPGIAGIVLTMGMAVDANVLIYERVREELKAGKGLKLAVADGFRNALSAILDGHFTTLITGIVLYVFGSGPIQGFATTLIIGVLTSLFTGLFVSRLIFEFGFSKNWNFVFDTKITRHWMENTKFDFIKMRKAAYIFSLSIITIGFVSLFTKGMGWGIDFTGGRTYVVRMDQDLKVNDVSKSLAKVFGEEPEVKTFGASNQIRITTKFMISENTVLADSIVEHKLYEGMKSLYKKNLTFKEFGNATSGKSIGVMSSNKVGPTIADDIKVGAIIAIIFALISISLYITVRFRRWEWGLGAAASLFHDTMFVIAFFSIFNGIMPFNLDVDQSFIAAILTVIGYSITDTVVIFDRIREYRTLHPRWDLGLSINSAINTTLRRTINTSGTLLVTLFAIFIFGGDVLRGFIFALLIGTIVGTYSSIFVATPIAYDILKKKQKNVEVK